MQLSLTSKNSSQDTSNSNSWLTSGRATISTSSIFSSKSHKYSIKCPSSDGCKLSSSQILTIILSQTLL
ncbi:TPA: hypothetical protein DEG21_02690 [Patescibacteria group bacterium]|nr:hypothetical protein [Candidatus Gracilibacteria bacterium]HBY74782.1 hypothetical protein [Candidatus Gracilibacteria bacterium]